MIFDENCLLMNYHTLSFPKLRKMSQNLSSAAVVIGVLRVNAFLQTEQTQNMIRVYSVCLWKYDIFVLTLVDLTSNFFVICTDINFLFIELFLVGGALHEYS